MGMSWRAIIAALGTTAELVRSAKNLRETVSDLGDRRDAPCRLSRAMKRRLHLRPCTREWKGLKLARPNRPNSSRGWPIKIRPYGTSCNTSPHV